MSWAMVNLFTMNDGSKPQQGYGSNHKLGFMNPEKIIIANLTKKRELFKILPQSQVIKKNKKKNLINSSKPKQNTDNPIHYELSSNSESIHHDENSIDQEEVNDPHKMSSNVNNAEISDEKNNIQEEVNDPHKSSDIDDIESLINTYLEESGQLKMNTIPVYGDLIELKKILLYSLLIHITDLKSLQSEIVIYAENYSKNLLKDSKDLKDLNNINNKNLIKKKIFDDIKRQYDVFKSQLTKLKDLIPQFQNYFDRYRIYTKKSLYYDNNIFLEIVKNIDIFIQNLDNNQKILINKDCNNDNDYSLCTTTIIKINKDWINFLKKEKHFKPLLNLAIEICNNLHVEIAPTQPHNQSIQNQNQTHNGWEQRINGFNPQIGRFPEMKEIPTNLTDHFALYESQITISYNEQINMFNEFKKKIMPLILNKQQ